MKEITFLLPCSSVSDWSDDNWNCLQDLINSPQKVGVGTLSQPCRFTIVESSLFSEIVDIYRLDKGKIYSYDNSSSSYVDSGKYISDNIPHHSWLYNSSTKKLFNYQGTSYTYIDH